MGAGPSSRWKGQARPGEPPSSAAHSGGRWPPRSSSWSAAGRCSRSDACPWSQRHRPRCSAGADLRREKGERMSADGAASTEATSTNSAPSPPSKASSRLLWRSARALTRLASEAIAEAEELLRLLGLLRLLRLRHRREGRGELAHARLTAVVGRCGGIEVHERTSGGPAGVAAIVHDGEASLFRRSCSLTRHSHEARTTPRMARRGHNQP